MHKFTKVEVEREKNKFQVTHHAFWKTDKSYEAPKSNLPPENKWMQVHKSNKWRERKKKFHVTTLFVRMIKLWSYEKHLTIWGQANAQVHKSSKWREKQISCHHTFWQNDKSYEVMESNLPPENKRMHKFTKQVEREKNKFYVATLFARMIKVWKASYQLRISGGC